MAHTPYEPFKSAYLLHFIGHRFPSSFKRFAKRLNDMLARMPSPLLVALLHYDTISSLLSYRA